MISDEPDEDADSLDDDNLLETYLGPRAGRSDAGPPEAAADGWDWPHSHLQNCDPGGDFPTVGWFKANHADWRLAMERVLRAWIDLRK